MSSDRLSLDELASGLQGFGHTIRIRTLVLLESEQSPSAIASVIGGSLGRISYHVRMLRDLGLIYETRTEPRRGALEHYYRRTELGDFLMRALAKTLDLPKRSPGRAGDKRAAELAEWVRSNANGA